MCIICNCSDDGDDFLSAFECARSAIKESKAAMLKCSKVAADAAARARYDAMHKKIARLLREWNAIEQEREHSGGGPHAG